jgi:hypothetical protein
LFMAGELMLTSEPSISQQGELTVRGHYAPVKGQVLSVDLSYVYGQGGWKSLGVNFRLDKAEE